MALTKKFLRSLDEAIERRTEYLRRLVVPAGQGAPMKYTRKVRDRLKAVGAKSRLPRAECLAIHLFNPRDNKQKKAAKVKWGKGCPICKRHDEVASEISALLRLRA